MKNFDEIFSEIEYLLKGYSSQFRTSVQPYRFQAYAAAPDYEFNPEDTVVRESLLEHVGMLPVLATYFHQYVTEPVNLGRALEMLAVHDIGELVVGDESVFTKIESRNSEETEAALKLLSPTQGQMYHEFEACETNDAKFAKSVDKIAPDIFDVLCEPSVTFIRLEHFAHLQPKQIVSAIERKKAPYMKWSQFFRAFHAALIEKLQGVLNKELNSVTAQAERG